MSENLHTWFVKQASDLGNPSQSDDTPLWLPLSRNDQRSLESALLAAEVGLGAVESVPVDGGRCEVMLEDRCYIDRYSVVPPPPPRPVRRVLWLRLVGGTDGTWQPYSEQVDEAIESTYNLLLESAAKSIDAEVPCVHFERQIPLNDSLNSVVHVEFNLTGGAGAPHWNMLAEERYIQTQSPRPGGGPSWLQALAGTAPSSSVKRTPVKRGYGEMPSERNEEGLLGEEIYRLVVCVHGFPGEEDASDIGRCLRGNLHRSQLQALGIEEDTEGNWGPEDKFQLSKLQPKTEVIEVFWHQNTLEAQNRSNALNDRLLNMALPSLPRVRELVNRASCDAILYTRYRDEILTAVKDSVEAALWRFYSCHEEFSGEVVLIGHCLGGMALFELLLETRLSCEVRALFVLGCPISLLLEEDGMPPLEESRFPSGTRFFNVFHPLDPVACRTEPLLMPELQSKPPAKVPTHRSYEAGLAEAGVQHMQAFLGRFRKEDVSDTVSDCGSVSSSRTKESTASPAQYEPPEHREARLKELIEFRLHGRLDWVLQSDVGSETASDNGDIVSSARASHFSYLRSFDIAAFLHSSCIQLVQPTEPDRPPPETVVDIFGRTVAKAGADAGSGLSSFWEKTKQSKAAENLRKFGTSANEKYNKSGAADVVKGTGQAVTGIFGTARAVYGTAKLIGGAASATSNLVSKAKGQ